MSDPDDEDRRADSMTLRAASWRKAGLHAFLALAVFVVGAGVIFYVAMSLLGYTSAWSDEPGHALAGRLEAAGSPIVRDVIFRPQTMIDPPEVDVWLRPGVSEAQAVALWCQTIAPAGGSPFEGDLGVVVWDDAGSQMMAVNPQCPGS